MPTLISAHTQNRNLYIGWCMSLDIHCMYNVANEH